MVADTNLVLSVAEVAVTVTLPPVGAVGGAVYVVGTVLDVEVGLKLPQGALLQVTDQVTPAFRLSLVTVAAMGVVAAGFMETGGVKPGVKVTATAGIVERWAPQAVRIIAAVVINARASWRGLWLMRFRLALACG